MVAGATRQELLWTLNMVIDEEERVAENLLKAFDLELFPPPPHRQHSIGFDEDALYTSTFMSTPLRTRHFSKLSPEILRDLLRSPPLRESTPSGDGSIESSISPNVTSRPAGICNAFLPLTPPPTGRIPFSAQLADSGRLQDITDTFLPAANHLISPVTVRHFQKVIDEMKGVVQEDYRTASVERPSILASISRPASPSFIDVIASAKRRLGVLEGEFVALLETRAADEEADAKELHELADRLEGMARARRRLAASIGDEMCEYRRSSNGQC